MDFKPLTASGKTNRPGAKVVLETQVNEMKSFVDAMGAALAEAAVGFLAVAVKGTETNCGAGSFNEDFVINQKNQSSEAVAALAYWDQLKIQEGF